MSFAVATNRTHVNTPYAVGAAQAAVIATCSKAALRFGFPVSRWRESAEERFQRLAETWRAERGPTSSVTEMAIHSAYQEIISMGWEAVPLLLRELERAPDHWFWALRVITGVDPVPPGARGRIRDMANAWLRWAGEQGIRC